MMYQISGQNRTFQSKHHHSQEAWDSDLSIIVMEKLINNNFKEKNAWKHTLYTQPVQMVLDLALSNAKIWRLASQPTAVVEPSSWDFKSDPLNLHKKSCHSLQPARNVYPWCRRTTLSKPALLLCLLLISLWWLEQDNSFFPLSQNYFLIRLLLCLFNLVARVAFNAAEAQNSKRCMFALSAYCSSKV